MPGGGGGGGRLGVVHAPETNPNKNKIVIERITDLVLDFILHLLVMKCIFHE
jgi:hypothetical protein